MGTAPSVSKTSESTRMRRYHLESIQNVVGAPLKISKPNKIHEDHRPLFTDWSWEASKDDRAEPKYRSGPEIREPDLSRRWATYEREYLAESRISKIWDATLIDAVIEPTNLIVAQQDKIIKETVKSKDVLDKLIAEASKSAMQNAGMNGGLIEVGTQLTSKRYIPQRCCLLGYGLFGNYFNWTIRYASRIRYFQALFQDCLLLVPASKRSYIAESLELFGVAEEKVRYVDEPVRVAELTMLSPSALGRYELSPHMVWTLREHPQIRALWSRPAKRLYIPRRNVKLRRVVNERELEASLERLGFAPFDCAAHSVREQAAAFKSADVIVAPHGAGLANIVYCKPGTRIVEIIPEGYDQGVTSYRSLADLFGLQYEVVFAREEKLDRKGNRCNSDISVNVPFLVETLSL